MMVRRWHQTRRLVERLKTWPKGWFIVNGDWEYDYESLTGDERRGAREYLNEDREALAELRRSLWSIRVHGGPAILRPRFDAEFIARLDEVGLGHLARPVALEEAIPRVLDHVEYLGALAHQDLADWLVAGGLYGVDRPEVDEFVDRAPYGPRDLDIDVCGPPARYAAFADAPEWWVVTINHPDFFDVYSGYEVTNRTTTVARDFDGTYVRSEANISRSVAELGDNVDPQNWNYITTFIDLAQRFDRSMEADGIAECESQIEVPDYWEYAGTSWGIDSDICETVDFGSDTLVDSDFKNRFHGSYYAGSAVLDARWEAPAGWLDEKLSVNSGFMTASAKHGGCKLVVDKHLKMTDPQLDGILAGVLILTVGDEFTGLVYY